MAILDGKNNIIQDFDVNKEYDVDLTFKEPSEYSINIYGKGNNGNFKIELNPKSDIEAIRKCY